MLRRSRFFLRGLVAGNLDRFFALFLLLLFMFFFGSGSGPSLNFHAASANATERSLRLSRTLEHLLEACNPLEDGVHINGSSRRARSESLRDQSQELPLWNEDDLGLSLDTIARVKQMHHDYIEATRRYLPHFEAPRAAPKRGIVMVTGSKHFPVALVSIRMMRRSGTTLPVEVFVAEGEYEQPVCDEILPSLNARCRVLPPVRRNSYHFKQHVEKAYAMLFSSFREMLVLDADSWALRDVEPVFTSRLFRRNGLITWPSSWTNEIASVYYTVSSHRPILAGERAASESGQLFVSKDRHWRTLLLVLYYNYWGPDLYYSIFSVSAMNSGVKDTFLPAAAALSLPFYDVKTPPGRLGHFKLQKDQGILTSALIQYDPVEEYEAMQPASASYAFQNAAQKPKPEPRPLFLHMIRPKWDPYLMLEASALRDAEGKPASPFRDPPELAVQVRGVDRMAWEEMGWVACCGYRFSAWEADMKPTGICEKAQLYFRHVLDADLGTELGMSGDSAMFPPLQGDDGVALED